MSKDRAREALDGEELGEYLRGETSPGKGASEDEPAVLGELVALQQKQREGTS